MNTRSWQLKFPQFWNSIANDTKTIALSFWFFTKLEISGYNRIIFQGCRLHWSSSFLMAELKRSWQYGHSCIAESLWKTLLLCCRCPNVNRTRFIFASAAVRWTYLRYCIMVFNIRIQKKVRQIGKLEQFDWMNYNIQYCESTSSAVLQQDAILSIPAHLFLSGGAVSCCIFI